MWDTLIFNFLTFMVVAGISSVLGYISVLLSRINRLLVFVPAALAFAGAFGISGFIEELLNYLSFDAIFALGLLMLYVGFMTSAFAVFYFWKSGRKKA
jgi:hypothetical protein